MSSPAVPELRVDRERLLARIQALHEIAPIDGGGNCRLALTNDDRAGRDLVVTMMRDLGLAVTIDVVGNVIAIRPGRSDGADEAPVMCGSHIDTVRTGGRYDGNLGVLAGLEIIETLDAAGVITKRPLAVAFFTDEEGARFAPDMLGSLVYAGGMAVEDALDTVAIDGARLGDELTRIGYAGPTPCPGLVPHAFVELHVEQGPVLELEGVTIGAVESVQGISWTELTIVGQSNHAGTTPMRLRHDAGLAAAEIAVFVRRLARELGGNQVATVGACELHPNLVNVVAGRAVLTVDLRNTSEGDLQQAERRLFAFVDELAATEGVAITARTLARFEPVIFDPAVVHLVERTALGLGHTVRRMPSGAGHDAQMMARICPTAMVFVPSVNGLSHNRAEHTDATDIEAGANVLLGAMLALANE
jgi:N-carbamoyl-L-amino-acid hydrolase